MIFSNVFIKKTLLSSACLTLVCWTAAGRMDAATYPNPETYAPSLTQCIKAKPLYDDPAPVLKTLGIKKVLPPDFYKMVVHDPAQMKAAWSEVVGFKAPDVVGKVAPEIKPGKYTYKDIAQHPGFKQLMPARLYERIKAGGPPLAGNIPDFEIVPTRQYYYPPAVSKATKDNMGKTKQDSQGYLVPDTWAGGFPFPRPSGNFKAMQIVYNYVRGSYNWQQNFFMVGTNQGIDKGLKIDYSGAVMNPTISFSGRTLFAPFGYLDERAKKRGEAVGTMLEVTAPRDSAGMTFIVMYYLSGDQYDDSMVYVPMLRRVKKMSSTDNQDPAVGQDSIYDDADGFSQKLSASRFPYKYEVTEAELLVPAMSLDGSEYISSANKEYKNVKLERRPMYVVTLTQTDPSYVYSKRILYIDRETYLLVFTENFNRKGRLYRSYWNGWGFVEEAGMPLTGQALVLTIDYIDQHSGWNRMWTWPAVFDRSIVSMERVIKKGK